MKKILLYLGMVSMPLLGLMGILKLGSRLQAPISVGGRWSLEAPSDSDCVPLKAFINAETLLISQSGPHLVLTLDDTSHTQLRGLLQGVTMQAVVHRPANQAAVKFSAQVDRSLDPDRLAGQVTYTGCGTPLLIEATRLPSQRALGGE